MSEIMGDFIDFAEITNQICRREMNRIYEFNVFLVGPNGIGKSTLIKSLFQGMIKPTETQTTKLNEYTELLEENGVKLRLSCIETSNFERLETDVFVKYIDKQLESYFKAQRRLSAWKLRDTRVHCCLYLIPPYGKMKLRQEDIDCMKALHEKVNLVPIISRADSFNLVQMEKFKENILADLAANNIKYFKFQYDDKEDEERFKKVKIEAERFPFAIVAADEPVLENKRYQWIRQTISGQINIVDSTKCDFDALAKLLIRHCMLDLIDSTHVKHYAKFKSELLQTAKLRNCENLQQMGLEAHEIKRIEYDTRSSQPHLRQLNVLNAIGTPRRVSTAQSTTPLANDNNTSFLKDSQRTPRQVDGEVSDLRVQLKALKTVANQSGRKSKFML